MSTLLHRLHPHFALTRVGYAVTAGAIVAAALATVAPVAITVLAAWNVAGALMLGLGWHQILTCDPNTTAHRAANDDPGRNAVYFLVLVTSAVSLFAATFIAHRAEALPTYSLVIVLLCLGTVALSWTLTNTAFTMRYAHLFYRDDEEGTGGLDFPGGAPPAFFDFAYFSFTLGMCFQVSDVTISSPQIRRVALLHAVMSYAYSTIILAFALNLAFGSFG